MPTTVETWGESLAVRIPPEVAERAGLTSGTPVELATDGDEVVLRPMNRLKRRKRGKLKAMVEAITSENQHDVIDWGLPVGKEVW